MTEQVDTSPTPASPEPAAPGTLAPPALPSWKRRLPNQLSTGRVVLAGVFVAMLSIPGAGSNAGLLFAAAVLFALAAFTDALDGYLARRWRVISQYGRVVDPFADKVLVLGAFVMLGGPAFAVGAPDAAERVQVSGVLPWMAVAILSRELLVTTIRGVYESRGVDFSATASGKIKMILQSIAAPLILLVCGLAALTTLDSGTAATINAVLAWGTVLVTLWSAVPYLRRALAVSRTGSENA